MLEQGITVSGKPLKDHLEAIDHAKALDWVLEIASQRHTPILEADIRNLHHLVMAKSKPEIAGSYADSARFVNTGQGAFQFPAPLDVPNLMQIFCSWLRNTAAPRNGFQSAPRLVAIHPFNDGNGRTARLLMNLILARAGFPPIAVRPEDRPAYIAALEMIQIGGDHSAFDELMLRRLDQTLDLYLAAAHQGTKTSANIPSEGN